MKYDLFVFDFDGTLADSRKNIANSVNRALKAKRLDQIDDMIIFPTIGKMPIQNLFIQQYPSLTKLEIIELTNLFRQFLTVNAVEEIILFEGVVSTLQILSQQKTLAILTTKHVNVMTELATALGIQSLFSIIYGSGLPGGDKPDGGCLKYIWSTLETNVDRTKTVMVGDTSVDLETANNAGIDSIGVTYGIDGPQVKTAGFTHTIDSFNKILGFM